MAWWPGHIDAGSLNVDMFSHMDWWPTVARLAGLEVPPREWTDNAGNPIIFDGIDLSDSLLGRGPGARDDFFYFDAQEFGGLRVKNYKMVFTAKDTWLGPQKSLKLPALYNLWWDPAEQYDIVFNGAAPTGGNPVLTRPLRRPGQRLDRAVHEPAADPVLRRAQDPPQHPLPALGRGAGEDHPGRVQVGPSLTSPAARAWCHRKLAAIALGDREAMGGSRS
jgi:hypothetical protein